MVINICADRQTERIGWRQKDISGLDNTDLHNKHAILINDNAQFMDYRLLTFQWTQIIMELNNPHKIKNQQMISRERRKGD